MVLSGIRRIEYQICKWENEDEKISWIKLRIDTEFCSAISKIVDFWFWDTLLELYANRLADDVTNGKFADFVSEFQFVETFGILQIRNL